MRWTSASVGISPPPALRARSRSERSFGRERPALSHAPPGAERRLAARRETAHALASVLRALPLASALDRRPALVFDNSLRRPGPVSGEGARRAGGRSQPAIPRDWSSTPPPLGLGGRRGNQ